MIILNEELHKEVRASLKEAACESIKYISYGTVMKKELAQDYDVSEKDVLQILDIVCRELVDKITAL